MLHRLQCSLLWLLNQLSDGAASANTVVIADAAASAVAGCSLVLLTPLLLLLMLLQLVTHAIAACAALQNYDSVT